MRLGVGFSLSAVHYLHARYVVGWLFKTVYCMDTAFDVLEVHAIVCTLLCMIIE